MQTFRCAPSFDSLGKFESAEQKVVPHAQSTTPPTQLTATRLRGLDVEVADFNLVLHFAWRVTSTWPTILCTFQQRCHQVQLRRHYASICMTRS
jgi:hypothetical protein